MKKISFFKWIKKYIKREFRRLREKHLLKVEHPTVTIDDDVVIKNPSRLALGENIYIRNGTFIECGGEKWCNYGGGVTIGDNVFIAPNVTLLGGGEIEIQRRCMIGPGVLITSTSPDVAVVDSDEKYLDNPTVPHELSKVTIEEGAMIGPNSVILLGVTIGPYAKIYGGSVIRKDVPPGTLILPNTKNLNKKYIYKKQGSG